MTTRNPPRDVAVGAGAWAPDDTSRVVNRIDALKSEMNYNHCKKKSSEYEKF